MAFRATEFNHFDFGGNLKLIGKSFKAQYIIAAFYTCMYLEPGSVLTSDKCFMQLGALEGIAV
jgi:hypothetical protein